MVSRYDDEWGTHLADVQVPSWYGAYPVVLALAALVGSLRKRKARDEATDSLTEVAIRSGSATNGMFASYHSLSAKRASSGRGTRCPPRRPDRRGAPRWRSQATRRPSCRPSAATRARRTAYIPEP
jgi:hypothetical protein